MSSWSVDDDGIAVRESFDDEEDDEDDEEEEEEASALVGSLKYRHTGHVN